MPLAFVIHAMPRSGSTWLSNWLSSGHSICWHDPNEWAGPEAIEEWADKQDRPAGICCTATWLLTHWQPQVPTLLLDRGWVGVNRSLVAKGLPELPEWVRAQWLTLPGERVTLHDLLNEERAREIHAKLLPGVPFDLARYQELCRMNVQPSEAELVRMRAYIAHYNSLNRQRA